jgi:ubiquinone/menaquinone biosynthesis C-methylase UbiE
MGLYQKLFAHGLALGDDAQHRLYGERKRQLFAGLGGTVVEIGPGTGVNLPYLPTDLRWIGLEPNPHMHDFLREQLERRNVDAELRTDPAQDTGLPDACTDVVISTLVLCSVPCLDDTLAELRRILKPGGRLLFIEHVAAPHDTWRYTLQRGIRPVWKRLADGCHPDRETGTALQEAGFSSVTLDRFDTGLPVVAPHIMGTATK